MRLPNQSAPVDRRSFVGSAIGSAGVTASNCGGIPNNILGRCFLGDGSPPLDRMNCAACCGLRTAMGWAAAHPNQQVANCQ